MRTQKTVTMANIYSYEASAFGYGYETRYIYKMVAEDGTVYVWKTTAFLTIEVPYTGKKGMHNFEDRKGNPVEHDAINKGDVLKVSFTEKGEGEYNGEKQMLVNRVKVEERIFKGKTAEEIAAEKEAEKKVKKDAQLDTIEDGDIIMRMPYKQFKEHYNDCETVIDSFERVHGAAYIEVIVRKGRLVPSGVRGQTFKTYKVHFTENGEQKWTPYKAVCGENAYNRAVKDFPNGKDFRVEEMWF